MSSSMTSNEASNRNGVRTSTVRSSHTAGKKISDKTSWQEQHNGRNALRIFPSGSSVASPKLGAPRGTTKKIQLGQSDRLQQSKLIQSSKDHTVPMMRREDKNTAKPQEHPLYYNLSRIQKTEGPKNPPITTQTWEKTSGPKIPAPPHVPITRSTKSSAPCQVMHENIKKTIPCSSRAKQLMHENVKKIGPSPSQAKKLMHEHIKKPEPSSSRVKQLMHENIKKTGPSSSRAEQLTGENIKKTVPSSSRAEQPMRENIKKTEPPSSQDKLLSEVNDPVYHITWKGFEEESEPVGQDCLLCEKAFSRVPNESSESDDEYESDDELDYYIDVFRSSVLPSVDILPCGHAFHSECLQLATSEECSNDPQCFICLSMA